MPVLRVGHLRPLFNSVSSPSSTCFSSTFFEADLSELLVTIRVGVAPETDSGVATDLPRDRVRLPTTDEVVDSVSPTFFLRPRPPEATESSPLRVGVPWTLLRRRGLTAASRLDAVDPSSRSEPAFFFPAGFRGLVSKGAESWDPDDKTEISSP